MSRLAAALQTQNRALRANILREFETLDALRARTPKFAQRSEQFQQSLLAGCAQNERALTQIFGAEATPTLLERVLPLDLLPSSSHHPYGGRWDSVSAIYDGLGSVWRHAVKDWSGHRGHELLHGRIVDALAAHGAESVLVAGCGQGRLATRIATRAATRARRRRRAERSATRRRAIHARRHRRAIRHLPPVPRRGAQQLDDGDAAPRRGGARHCAERRAAHLSLRLGSFDATRRCPPARAAPTRWSPPSSSIASRTRWQPSRRCARASAGRPRRLRRTAGLPPPADARADLGRPGRALGRARSAAGGRPDVVEAPHPERPGALREESAWRAGFFVARRAE